MGLAMGKGETGVYPTAAGDVMASTAPYARARARVHVYADGQMDVHMHVHTRITPAYRISPRTGRSSSEGTGARALV